MLAAERRLSSETPLMLSMPSFYALEWTQLFCRAVKRLNSGVQIVVGGRWVTGPDPAWLQRKLPEADTIVSGLGEGRLPALVGLPSDCVVGSRDVPDYGLHHRIIDGFERYQPSIEASRGCGMGCAFCEERDIKSHACVLLVGSPTCWPRQYLITVMAKSIRIYNLPSSSQIHAGRSRLAN